MFLHQHLGDLLLKVVAVGSWSNMNYNGLNMLVDLLSHHLVERLIGVYLKEGGVISQEWKHVLGQVMVLLDFLGQNGGGNVSWSSLSKSIHPLLANILWTVKSENVGRHLCISDETLGLSDILWEVFQDHSGHDLPSQGLNKMEGLLLIIMVLELVLLHVLIEVNALHIGPGSEVLSDGGLSRLLWSNHTDGLRKDSLLRLLKNG